MSVIFDNCPGATSDEDERFHYVVAYDDLGSICQVLKYQDGIGMRNLSDTTFEVTIHHRFELRIRPRPNSVQRRLLEPFTGLHSVRKFTITGHVNTEYAKIVIARVTRPAPGVEETIDRVMLMTREARNLSDRRHHAQAIDKYKSALVQSFIKLAPKVLQKGPLIGRTGSFAFRYLDFMLASKIAMCHAELDEWEEAHYWACEATKTTFFPIKYAEAIYRMAWVVDIESNKAVQDLETLFEKLTDTPEEGLYMDQDLSDLEEKMRSKEGMDNLRGLKAVMKGLADRDWVGDSIQE